MIINWYIWLNGKLVLFYQENSQSGIYYPDNSIGFYMWRMLHEPEKFELFHQKLMKLIL